MLFKISFASAVAILLVQTAQSQPRTKPPLCVDNRVESVTQMSAHLAQVQLRLDKCVRDIRVTSRMCQLAVRDARQMSTSSELVETSQLRCVEAYLKSYSPEDLASMPSHITLLDQAVRYSVGLAYFVNTDVYRKLSRRS